jgi:branched-chain amino acid transport system substrate-binding protein
VFRICDDARTATYALAALIHEKFPQVKKWANISPDYEYGHSAWENFIEKLMQIDPEVKVVADRWPKFGAGGGYAPHINAILASGAEGLYSVLYGGDMIAFIREGRQHGLFDKIKVFTSTAVPSDIPYALQKEMVGVWTRDHYLDVIYTHPFSEKYKKYFKNTYGDKFFTSCQGQGTPVFDSVYAFKAAIEKAKSFEVKDIRKALEDLTLDTNLGKKWIRAGDHQAYFNMPFFHIMPDPKEEIGWKIDWFTTIDGKKFMIPVEEALKK